jgi:hypothetical protein
MLGALAHFGFEIVFGAVGLYVTVLVVGCIVWFVGRMVISVVALPFMLVAMLISTLERRFSKAGRDAHQHARTPIQQEGRGARW